MGLGGAPQGPLLTTACKPGAAQKKEPLPCGLGSSGSVWGGDVGDIPRQDTLARKRTQGGNPKWETLSVPRLGGRKAGTMAGGR